MRLQSLLTNPLFVFFAVLSLGVLAVAYGTIAQNAWGINLGQTFCPRCNATLPKKRKPRSGRQSLWGGCTCPACGAEVDKWGREIRLRPGRWSDFYNEPRSVGPIRLSFIGVIVSLDVWYDVYYRTVSFFDAAIIVGLAVLAVKSSRT